MLIAILVAAAAASAVQAADGAAPVQSRNGEFIFRQYPPLARAAGEQGTVKFRAEVDAKGNVMSCKVVGSSGYRRLDDETCEMIVDHATFKPTLDGEGKAREAIHDGLVHWRLPGVTAASAPKIAEAQTPDKLICKRVPKTGSLVSHSRLCMTARQWEHKAEQIQDEWGSLQGRYGSTHGN